MLYKIRCNQGHPLNGTLLGPYVPVRVTLSALVAHRYTHAPPRCRTSQYSRTFIPLSVSLWNDLANPVFNGVGLTGFKRGPMLFYWPKMLYPYYSLLLLLLLLKKVGSARLGESDIHPISPKTPAPQYQPIDRKKTKGKRVEDYSRDRAA